MILSAEALDILAYLESSPGQFATMGAICRRAGGRRRFDETPGWAKGLMGPLVEAGLIEINERGHYRFKGADAPVPTCTPQAPKVVKKPRKKIVGDDYFPAPVESGIVGDNYFPPGG